MKLKIFILCLFTMPYFSATAQFRIVERLGDNYNLCKDATHAYVSGFKFRDGVPPYQYKWSTGVGR
jgi:hypothetical protein